MSSSDLRPTSPATTAPAADTPVGPAATTVSVRPVVLPAPGRGEDLQLRVTAPVTGERLPVVVFSHGFGMSMDAYGPVTEFWASHGFVVLQPTHLDSATLGLGPDDPRTPRIWRIRVEDMVRALDGLETVERAVPGLQGRLDGTRVAAAGHSYGATTASALLGARVLDAAGTAGEDMTDARFTTGVLLGLAGVGGEDLTDLAKQLFPFMNPQFDAMTAPALIVGGDADQSPLSTRGPDWWTDAYRLSPAGKHQLTLFGADHYLGGVPAYGGVPMTPAENPALLALVRQLSTAYLRTALGVDDASFPAAREALAGQAEPAGRLESN